MSKRVRDHTLASRPMQGARTVPPTTRVSRTVLHHRFRGLPDGSHAVAIFGANRGQIDAAVARRATEGALKPVMVRDNDLPKLPR